MAQPQISHYHTKLDNSFSPTDTIVIDLEPRVFMPGAPDAVDWDSFTFVAATGQSLTNPRELVTTNGEARFLCGERKIEYEINTQNENVDLIQFILYSDDGNPSNLAAWTIDYEELVIPTAVNDSITIAAGQSGTLNILSNDTGNVQLNSIEIIGIPTGLTVINNQGNLTISAANNAEGSYTFDYRFRSTNGLLSNTATVTVTVQNAGTGTKAVICPLASLSLFSFLSGNYTAGGTWTANPGNPSTPSIANPAAVDFTSANAGSYVFTYTVGSSSADIFLGLPDYGISIDTVGPIINNPFSTPPTALVSFTAIGVNTPNNIQITVTFDAGNPGEEVDTYGADSWNAGSGQTTIQLPHGAGDYDIEIDVIDSCGNKHSDTWPTITI
jgi:hypothetical protein